jgi:hypothetical protein
LVANRGVVSAVRVRHCRSAATLPTSPHPPVEFVKINRPGQHQQSGRDQVFASLAGSGEPATGDDSGAFDADVVSPVRHIAEMISEWLQLGPPRGE